MSEEEKQHPELPFVGEFPVAVEKNGFFRLPDKWAEAVGDQDLIAIHHHKSGQLLFVFEGDVDSDKALLRLIPQSFKEGASRKTISDFKHCFSPSIYLEDVERKQNGIRALPSTFNVNSDNKFCIKKPYKGAPFNACLRGRENYFLLKPDDDRWVLSKPARGNDRAARIVAYWSNPTNHPSDPEQNPKGPQPGDA